MEDVSFFYEGDGSPLICFCGRGAYGIYLRTTISRYYIYVEQGRECFRTQKIVVPR